MPGGYGSVAGSPLQQEDAVSLLFAVSAPKNPRMGGMLLLWRKEAGAGWAGSPMENRVLPFFRVFLCARGAAGGGWVGKVGSTGQAEVGSSSQ